MLYPSTSLCGVAILYSLMIALAATSIWLGRNQTLYDFWFYITNFSRYPMEIYQRPLGTPLRRFFTFIVPVLVVVNVPARLLAQPLDRARTGRWPPSRSSPRWPACWSAAGSSTAPCTATAARAVSLLRAD